jgi:ComF family protein
MPVQEPVCQVCGLPQNNPGICDRCQEAMPAYHQLRAWAVFDGPLRAILHKLKYRRNLSLGDTLAQAMVHDVMKLNWSIDLVVPIPLGEKRRRERGYNQVALVAMPLAASLKWQYAPRALKRIRETRSQVGLSYEERRENTTNAFASDARLVGDRTVLLMDDVATTGATLSAAASALSAAGARKIYALTLARALPKHGLRVV